MPTSRTTLLLFALCGIAWVAIVARTYLNVKGPEDFVVTVSQKEVQAFARTQLDAVQQRSIARNTELCAIIFEDSAGELGATPLREGSEASCDIAYFDEPGMAPLASFHTHGSFSEGYDSEVPSLTDMQSDIESGTDGYIATPGGRLWWVDSANQRAQLVCGEGCLTQDPNYRPCGDDRLEKVYTPQTLAQRETRPTAVC